MKEVHEIFNLCINKGLFFNYSPHVFSISVYNEDMSFNYYAYYDGGLVNVSGDISKTLEELKSLIEKYK